jgi:hypothetical protein
MSGGSLLKWMNPTPKKKFFDYSEEERVELMRKAIKNRETQMLRWDEIEREKDLKGWIPRSVKAARYFDQCDSVVDLGCGTMSLECYLKPGTKYIPVDVARRDKRTILVDLNREPLPILTAGGIAGLGLLGYLFDVPGLIKLCADRYRFAVFSYNAVDMPGAQPNRLANAWVNAYSSSDLEAIFTGHGFQILDRHALDQSQLLWQLRGRGSLQDS